MKTDPRAACANAHEYLGWAVVHDAIAHPLMAASGYSKWALRFHDWTSLRAWPRLGLPVYATFRIDSRRHGAFSARQVAPGFYSADCPFLKGHSITAKAGDWEEAMEQFDLWFDELKR